MTGQQGWKKGALGYYGTEQALDYTMDTMSDLMLPEDTGPTDIVIPAEDLGPPEFPRRWSSGYAT